MPYNIHIDAPISRDTAIFIAGDATYQWRNIKIMGGSIEGYSKIAPYFLDLSVFGTYFETISQRLVSGIGVSAIDPLANGAHVALYGCLAYIDYTARFVNLSGLTGGLTRSGNNFDGGVNSAAGVIYYLPSSGSVSLAGDRYSSALPNDCLYVDAIGSALKFNVFLPALPSGKTQASYSQMQIVGSRGAVMGNLSAEPSSKVAGMTVYADGDTWDPLSRGQGRAYWVQWQSDRWRGMDGIGSRDSGWTAGTGTANKGALPLTTGRP